MVLRYVKFDLNIFAPGIQNIEYPFPNICLFHICEFFDEYLDIEWSADSKK